MKIQLWDSNHLRPSLDVPSFLANISPGQVENITGYQVVGS